MRARVQEDHRPFGERFEGLQEGSEGQANRLGVVVRVGEGINANITEDSKVVDWT